MNLHNRNQKSVRSLHRSFERWPSPRIRRTLLKYHHRIYTFTRFFKCAMADSSRKRLSFGGRKKAKKKNSNRFQNEIAIGLNSTELDEYLLEDIASHLREKELSRLAQVCRRYRAFVDTTKRWECIYKELYEYDLPLMIEPDDRRVYFVQTSVEGTEQHQQDPTLAFPGMEIEEWNESGTFFNVWRESISRLYTCSVHVRPGYRDRDRAVWYFDTIVQAYVSCRLYHSHALPIIFIHPGKYIDDIVCIEMPIIMLGCGPGRNPAGTVVIESHYNRNFNCIQLLDNRYPYLGYVTLSLERWNTDFWDSFDFQFCVLIWNGSTAIIDRCILRSGTPGHGIRVMGRADPTIRNCDISVPGGTGIYMDSEAVGLYERNILSSCYRAFQVGNSARPTFRQNLIHYCSMIGMMVTDEGQIYLPLPWDI